jgi:hypothetical protein
MTAGGAGLWLAAGGVVAAGAAAAAGLFGGSNPQDLVRAGMQKFRKVSSINTRCFGFEHPQQISNGHSRSAATMGNAPLTSPAEHLCLLLFLAPNTPASDVAFPPSFCLQNDVEGSVQDFDAAMALQPQMRPYLWQRGLSLYYLKDFQEAAQQFR